MATDFGEMCLVTLHDYASSAREDSFFLQWWQFKNLLTRYFTRENWRRTTDEYKILISSDTLALLDKLSYKTISIDELGSRLEDLYPGCAAVREKARMEEYTVLLQQNRGNFFYFVLNLDELKAHLNEIKVFGLKFIFQETFAGKKRPHLRMTCADIDAKKINEFVTLLKKCSMTASIARKNTNFLVVVEGPIMARDFLEHKSKLIEFASNNKPNRSQIYPKK